MQPIIKLLGTAASIGAGFVSAKVVDIIWEKTTGHKAPKKGEDVDQSFVQAIVFAVVSATVSAVITQAVKKGQNKVLKGFNRSRTEVA
ncbi:DUF4235 domain-containing protein [Falsarthrobacter nasiphocae]|uniref:DUF4235 domain-containing protein n=1 Tax=Falsarthrobacter nasiphocae TaxID=189863 RepID=A0AAE3YIC0_9MICC|nr:DUF4235 domain-containing protein [Falsarthrobacter nasiphocae]MDR6892291.1 hypothetical protein [Falsarthrobacter nasiphocae]